MRKARLIFLAFLIAPLACAKKPADPPAPPQGQEAAKPRPRGQGEVRTEMRGVNFRIDPQLVLEVRRLRGALEPTREGKPPWFDDPGSFVVRIDSGEVAMTPDSLAAAMNHYLFAGPGAPVKDVEIQIRDGHLIQSSTLNKKVPVRATLEGEVSATPDGDLRFHPTKIEAGKLPVKGLLDLLGIELSGMIKSQESKGLRVVGDDLILDPERLLPPPRIHGRVTAVRIEGDRLVQVFGDESKTSPLSPSLPKAKNYMYMKGGVLSFGKLTMNGADLQIVDADPKDPFDFFLAQYARQLTAGYSKTLPDKGVVVYMPDSGKTGGGQLTP